MVDVLSPFNPVSAVETTAVEIFSIPQVETEIPLPNFTSPEDTFVEGGDAIDAAALTALIDKNLPVVSSHRFADLKKQPIKIELPGAKPSSPAFIEKPDTTPPLTTDPFLPLSRWQFPSGFAPDLMGDLPWSGDGFLFSAANHLDDYEEVDERTIMQRFRQEMHIGSVLIANAVQWRIFREMASKEWEQQFLRFDPAGGDFFKFVALGDGTVYVGPMYFDKGEGKMGNHEHRSIGRHALQAEVEAAGYFSIGPGGELVVYKGASPFYGPPTVSGPDAVFKLQNIFGPDIIIVNDTDLPDAPQTIPPKLDH